MKITIRDLFEARENLPKLTAIKDVPAKTGYWIAKLIRKLGGPLSDADQARNNLVHKYAATPEEMESRIAELNKELKGKIAEGRKKIVMNEIEMLKDGQTRVAPGNMVKFLEELAELTKEEVEIDIEVIKFPEDVLLPDATVFVGLDNFFEMGS